MKGRSSPRALYALGTVFILFAVSGIVLIAAGVDASMGRIGSWAIIGIPLGLACIISGFVQSRRERSGGRADR